MSRDDAAPMPPEHTLVDQTLAVIERPLTPSTRERLTQALLDWLTAGWAARSLPAAARMRALASVLHAGEGAAPVFGGPPMTAMAAAMANAGIAHLREIDDAHRAAMLHPGVVAVSPALALAADLGLTQRRFAQAVLAGYEVALRVGESLGAGHAGRFHATATAGSVGAAAAAAVGLGLPRSALHDALGIAATQAAGLWQIVDDEAHEAKSLHPAFAVRNGMTAAQAARLGFPGARAFVTGRRGLRALMAGDGPLAALTEAADAAAGPVERLHTATIKAWPACAMLFTPLDATLALIEQHHLSADDVEAVDVEIFTHALKIAGVTWPAKAVEAPFCLRYLLATLLQRGRIGLDDTETPELDSPMRRALADRITVRTSDDFQRAFPSKRPCRVTISLTSGAQISAYRELRRGDPEDPFSWHALQARLRAFVPSMEEAQVRTLVDFCERLLDRALDDQRVVIPFGLL